MIVLFLLGGATSGLAGDWQYWGTWSATHDISDKTRVSVLAEAYFRDCMSDDYVYNEYVSCSRKLGYGLVLLGQLYFESTETTAGSWNGTRSVAAGLSYAASIPK